MGTIKKIIFMDDANTFINQNNGQDIKDFFSIILKNLKLMLKKKIKCPVNIAETVTEVDIVCFYQFMENDHWSLYRYQLEENQTDAGNPEEMGAFVNAEGIPYPIKCIQEQLQDLGGQDDDLLLIFCDYKWAYAPNEHRDMPFKVLDTVRCCNNCLLIYYTSIEPEAAQEFIDKAREDDPGMQCKLFKNEWSVSRYAKSSKADLDKTIFNLYSVLAEFEN